eukprot:TRINITY_DN204_c3_g1_i1.p1 TRINITY_DN204_c3_g1~~TRINITY_DN204_c3_g1_i1.p1  ORF type:complete len:206 (+),score=57.87 TRINITY_DN204_c3_g1_i1:591-1208(+)
MTRTFPNLAFFSKDGTHYQDLCDVLQSYAIYNPTIGYVQGMSYITAVFLLYLDPADAFICLANILQRPIFFSFYSMDANEIEKYGNLLILLLHEKLTPLYHHFKQHNIVTAAFLVDWIMTIFAKSLSIETASHLWDIYFVEGDCFIWRICLGILSVLSGQLLQSSFEGCLQLLTHLPRLDCRLLLNAIQEIELTQAQVDNIFRKL